MTDSDRQDDGLLSCPFCGGLDLTVYSNADIGCWVACVDCGLETPTETGTTKDDAIKYWNTRTPSREAAEGARDFVICDACPNTYPCEGHQRCMAAPKPAPDAIREALAPLRSETRQGWNHLFDYLNGASVGFSTKWIERFKALQFVLSAPVPPADGANDSEDVDLCPGGYWRGSDVCRTCNCRAPSPAVAAEPFGWLAADGKFSLPAEMTREKFLALFPEPLVGTPVIALYAAPPVRGEREAIARSLAKSLWSGASFDDGTQAAAKVAWLALASTGAAQSRTTPTANIARTVASSAIRRRKKSTEDLRQVLADALARAQPEKR